MTWRLCLEKCSRIDTCRHCSNDFEGSLWARTLKAMRLSWERTKIMRKLRLDGSNFAPRYKWCSSGMINEILLSLLSPWHWENIICERKIKKVEGKHDHLLNEFTKMGSLGDKQGTINLWRESMKIRKHFIWHKYVRWRGKKWLSCGWEMSILVTEINPCLCNLVQYWQSHVKTACPDCQREKDLKALRLN